MDIPAADRERAAAILEKLKNDFQPLTEGLDFQDEPATLFDVEEPAA